MVEKRDVKKVVDQLEKLPSLPVVVSKIISVVDSPNVNAADINKIISTDQALTAKVLRLVNSAFYGFPGRISTVTQAIVILGLNTIKSVAMSATVFDMVQPERSGGINRQIYWQESILCGVLAKHITKQSGHDKPEEGFVAGVMHDIGRVILDQFFPEDYIRVMNFVREKNADITAAEQFVFGLDHTQVGVWLSKKWNLPSQLAEPIAFYREPEKAQEAKKVTMAVHIAERMVAGGMNLQNIMVRSDYWTACRMDRLESLDRFFSEVENDVRKTDAFYSMAQGG